MWDEKKPDRINRQKNRENKERLWEQQR
jgi:hypothetical protein